MPTGPDSGVPTRRNFLQWSQSMLGMLGIAPLVGSAEALASPSSSHAPASTDYYSKLGVKKMINAAGITRCIPQLSCLLRCKVPSRKLQSILYI